MILTDDSIMEAGKYIGKPFKDIPTYYWFWFRDKFAPTYENQNIHDYINNKYKHLKKNKL